MTLSFHDVEHLPCVLIIGCLTFFFVRKDVLFPRSAAAAMSTTFPHRLRRPPELYVTPAQEDEIL